MASLGVVSLPDGAAVAPPGAGSVHLQLERVGAPVHGHRHRDLDPVAVADVADLEWDGGRRVPVVDRRGLRPEQGRQGLFVFGPVATRVTLTVIGPPVLTTGVAFCGVPVASSTSQEKVDGFGALPSLEQIGFGKALTSFVLVPNGLLVEQSGTLPPPLWTVLTNVIPWECARRPGHGRA